MSATCACKQLLEERSSTCEKELSIAINALKCTQSAPVEAHQTTELHIRKQYGKNKVRYVPSIFPRGICQNGLTDERLRGGPPITGSGLRGNIKNMSTILRKANVKEFFKIFGKMIVRYLTADFQV